RRTLTLKDQLASRYADLLYEGRWWSTEREALDALVEVTQRRVTGEVRLRLYKGTATVLARQSPFSLYAGEYATFEADGVYRQADAAGFIRLFGLPITIGARVAARR
ncbi:MAG: argininosuccinate synthase, partial [Gemmatimonadetes bacterium]|nr:argininosuccinate synthase [Gemmatimonadota bacterium]